MNRLKRTSEVTSMVLLLCCWTGPAFATLPVRYIDETVLVFQATDVMTQRLPYRTLLNNASPVFGSDVLQSCLGVLLNPPELVIYLTQTQSCIQLTALSASRLRHELGYSSVSGFERDHATFKDRLEGEPVIVLEPLEATAPPGSICLCNQPEKIFGHGFEDFVAVFYMPQNVRLMACRES